LLDLPDDVSDFSYVIEDGQAGIRLDHFLVERMPDYSRSQLTSSIKKGLVKINNLAVKASRKLQRDDIVTGSIEQTPPAVVVPQYIEFDILFEDEYLIVLSKPPGLVVHPASGNVDKTLVNGLLYHYNDIQSVGDPIRPGIVHRLDKDTSGVMVAAKTNDVLRQLVDAFKSRSVRKKYHAIVLGTMSEDQGRIVAPIGRHPVNRKKMSIRQYDGRFAASSWHLKNDIDGRYSFVEIEIETGRTHQIRVHMASIGHPVAGDIVYGPKKANPLFPRQMLHSSELIFTHPVLGRKMIMTAPLWSDMAKVLTELEQCD